MSQDRLSQESEDESEEETKEPDASQNAVSLDMPLRHRFEPAKVRFKVGQKLRIGHPREGKLQQDGEAPDSQQTWSQDISPSALPKSRKRHVRVSQQPKGTAAKEKREEGEGGEPNKADDRVRQDTDPSSLFEPQGHRLRISRK
jgi:hypothetical protein